MKDVPFFVGLGETRRGSWTRMGVGIEEALAASGTNSNSENSDRVSLIRA